jgi:HlyD family secretion protein
MLKRTILIALGAAVVVLAVALAVVLAAPGSSTEGDNPVAAGTEVQVAPGPEAAPGTAAQPDYQVVAEGVVVPVQNASLSMAASGVVAEVLAHEGDSVAAGQPILRLQSAHQQAAVAQAQAALANAQAQLDGLQAGARAQEIAASQAGLDAAQARLNRLKEGARTDEIAAARAALAAAQEAEQRLYAGPTEQQRIAAEADRANAEAALSQAQAAYDRVSNQPEVAMLPESLALQQATNTYDAAKARYDALFAAPDQDVVASAQAQIKQAQSNLDLLLKPATDSEIAEAEAMVRQSQAQLDLLLAGPRDQEIAAAVAGVAEAQAVLQQAQASLADTELLAPFAGTVAAVQIKIGEQVVAGVPVVQLADLTSWQVETDDLTELDIVHVHEGDRVTLTFDAIPDLVLNGTVVRIKPIGEEKLGDMTYTVTIAPEQQDPRLRWRMTAVATIP